MSDFTPLSFVNGAYLPLLEAWRTLSDEALPQTPHIYCMDQEAFDHCDGDDRFVTHRPSEFEDFSKMGLHRRLRYFWLRRFDMLEEYLKRGESFIHTDLDAFWHRDISLVIESIDADMIISREFGLPRSAVDAWGFALCCGLFAVRPTAATRALFAAWRAELPKTYDDQIALNTLLLDTDIQWEDIPCEDDSETNPLGTENPYADLIASYGTADIAGEKIRIVVLSDDAVARYAPIADMGAEPSPPDPKPQPQRQKGLPFISHPFFERHQQKSSFKLYAAFGTCGLPTFDTASRRIALDGLDISALKPREVQDYLALCWALDKTGNDADWLVHRATLALKAGASECAVADLEAALELQPGHSAAAMGLFDAYRSTKNTNGQARMAARLSQQHHVDKLAQRSIAKRLMLARKPFAAGLFASRALRLAVGERIAYWRELWNRSR